MPLGRVANDVYDTCRSTPPASRRQTAPSCWKCRRSGGRCSGARPREFEQRVFLSTLNDIRNFCEAYGIEEPRSKSRASGIPRVFKFLVTMDVADVERMLDDRMFSGPAQLGPIADPIRGKAKEYRDVAIDHN